ncbi:MAG: Nucleosomal histone H3-Lys79 methylase [Vezdaea aestivalis]|nr:MAG: Nucleosomal histone H3-Lys79 methylase [Vezdaea aestivalis]
MGFFDQFNKNGAANIKTKVAKIKKESVKSLKPISSARANPGTVPRTPRSAHGPSPKSISRSSGGSKPGIVEEKSQAPTNSRKRARPSQEPLLSSSDEGSDDEELALPIKKPKRNDDATIIDPYRKLRASISSFSSGPKFIHGSDIASLGNKKYRHFFNDLSDETASIILSCPGTSKAEEFDLVAPTELDDFQPLEDIVETIKTIGRYYLPDSESSVILDETSGIVRKLDKARRSRKGPAFKAAVHSFNSLLADLQDRQIISKTIDALSRPPLPLIERILNQSYARTVSLKVESLRKYENGTDNVYGELLPKFITTILTDSRLTSNQIFVDLGSGVGNVVLQAALEVGCESWGCEMMENACALAEAQEKEFHARCRMWDLRPGKTQLERGDFLTNAPINKILRKADVVLVNNQAFTPGLNDALTHLFLDLKEGCQIISLKSFVPHDHVISYRNANSPVNLLEVKEKVYFSGSVSWKDAPGTYYVAVKDSRKLRAFDKARR